MNAVLNDWKTAVLPAKTHAALRLLERLTLDPMAIDHKFVELLRADGLDDHPAPAQIEALGDDPRVGAGRS